MSVFEGLSCSLKENCSVLHKCIKNGIAFAAAEFYDSVTWALARPFFN